MKLYCGIDLHLNNSFVVVMDETARVLYKKRLASDVSVILHALLPAKLIFLCCGCCYSTF